MGLKISVLKLYSGESATIFTFDEPRAVLEQKGFEVQLWTEPPTAAVLAAELASACQLWVISTNHNVLGADHCRAIQAFFRAGGGLYLWGDNAPYFADVNALLKPGAPWDLGLGGVQLTGNELGQQMLTVADANGWAAGQRRQSFSPGHLLTTGLGRMLEGNTISWLEGEGVPLLEPLCYSSGGNLLCAAYDRDGRRAVIDGGYTRLYGSNWGRSVGSPRFVVNSATWLANSENQDRER